MQIGSPNAMRHFEGNGTSPTGPANGNNGVIEVRQAEQPSQQLDIGQHGVDLFGADDRTRHNRRLGP